MSNTEKLKFAEIKHAAALDGLHEAQAQHDRAVEAGESVDVLAVLKRNIREARIVLGDEGRELEFLRWCVAREES
ncbi:hypothetical protein [Roseovarius indicus]|uniref:hypothetical protein n=1 Tax=Roseovarius indicus TaxID=540747 RepID=UPI004057F1D7